MFDKKSILIIIFDLLTFVLAVIGITFSMFDVRFMVDLPRMSTLPIMMTFTGLSNAFLGLVCLACALYRLFSKNKPLPKFLLFLKIIALAEISITMLTTAFILAPMQGASWWRFYINNNLFNHLLTPLLGIVTFITLEPRVDIAFKYSFFSFVPIIAYGVFYLVNIYTHLTNEGKIDQDYDIYHLLRFGAFPAVLFFLLFMSLTFGFTVLFIFINKKKA